MKLLLITALLGLMAMAYAIEDYAIVSPWGQTRVYQQRLESPIWNAWNGVHPGNAGGLGIGWGGLDGGWGGLGGVWYK